MQSYTQDCAVLENVLSYIASEVQPSIGGLFNPAITEDVKTHHRNQAAKKLTYLEDHLISNKLFSIGSSFTIADVYLYIVLTWTKYLNIDLAPYPRTKAYFERIGALENVQGAFARIATEPTTTV